MHLPFNLSHHYTAAESTNRMRLLTKQHHSHLEQDEPALQVEKKRLARSLSSQGLGQTTCHMLSVAAPLTPHMLKQLLGQLQHDTYQNE